ncbi:hypothetical protein GOV11_01595 [Candidatus Woesearchaeota archaeon]|nr:hypothetical protein [Candidatus Woesearchaeota archaeon]
MAVTIDIDPENTYETNWDFVLNNPGYTAALDGVVQAEGIEVITFRDKPYLIADHHIGNRFSQLTTCEQIYEWVKDRGPEEDKFEPGGELDLNVLGNHMDADFATSVSVLRHKKEIFSNLEFLRRIREQVNVEGSIDRSLAFFDIEENMWARFMWLFDPLYQARFKQGFSNFSPEDNVALFEEVDKRFVKYYRGEGRIKDPWGDYEVLHRGGNWRIARETGPDARRKMWHDKRPVMHGGQGVELYILLKEERATGKFDYTMVAPRRNASLGGLKDHFNGLEEDLIEKGKNQWGGNLNCIGSPRITGSGLSPSDMAHAMNELDLNMRIRVPKKFRV